MNKHKIEIRHTEHLDKVLSSIKKPLTIEFTGSQSGYIDSIEFETESIKYSYLCFALDPRYADDYVLLGVDVLKKNGINYPQLHSYFSKAQLNKMLSEIKIGE